MATDRTGPTPRVSAHLIVDWFCGKNRFKTLKAALLPDAQWRFVAGRVGIAKALIAEDRFLTGAF